jgi:hypothetical protein
VGIDGLGSNAQMRGFGQQIVSYSTITYLQFTVVEITTIQTVQTTVQTTKAKVNQRIKEVEILLKAYTNTDIAIESVNIGNLAIEVPSTTEPAGECVHIGI